MNNPAEKLCFVCHSSFNFISSKRQVCQFCFKSVCRKCSAQKLKHKETQKAERICDGCYSEYLQEEISKQFAEEKLRLLAELKNTETNVENEKVLSLKEDSLISGINSEIRDFKKKYDEKIEGMEEEAATIEEEMQQISKDFFALNSSLEAISMQIWEIDSRLQCTQEDIEEACERADLAEKIRSIEQDISFYYEKLGGNDTEMRKSQFHAEDLKIFRVKQEISNLSKEKIENSNKLKKLKENEIVKNPNISMLMNKLIELNNVPKSSTEDLILTEEQEKEINFLENKLSLNFRRNQIESKTCKCCIT